MGKGNQPLSPWNKRGQGGLGLGRELNKKGVGLLEPESSEKMLDGNFPRKRVAQKYQWEK